MIRLGANFDEYYIKYSMKKERAVGPESAVSFMLGARSWFDIDDVAVGLSIRRGAVDPERREPMLPSGCMHV